MAHVCWKQEDAKAILRTLALAGNEAVFLATHSPITNLEVRGTHAHEVREPTDEGLRAVLSDRSRTHAMCVVEGEPGSGKSHLIRWLKVTWPEPKDLVLLIERSDGTLVGTLKQIATAFEPTLGEQMRALRPQQQLTAVGQANLFLSHLAVLTRERMMAQPLGDELWCEKYGVAGLLQTNPVRRDWKAPARVLATLTDGEDRDSGVARFTAEDVAELARIGAGIDGTALSPGAVKLCRKLRSERERAGAVAQSGAWEPDPASETARLVNALNGRIGVAVQAVLGISGDTLMGTFRELRRSLRKQGRRLVILLEDITSAQGVDKELLQVLQEQSETQPEWCDLVAVVGITPAYYKIYVSGFGHVAQRITHHVRFGGTAAQGFQDVATLADPSAQAEFAARYIRAVRAGQEDVTRAMQEGRKPSNPCRECEDRRDCLRAFGEVDGVGLYPLSRKAVTRMFTSLSAPDMNLRTPRGMIQAVLAPSFDAVPALLADEFPPASVVTEWHGKHGVDQFVAREAERFGAKKDQFERLVEWWGDGAVRDDHSPDTWAGVPVGTFRTFGFDVSVLVAGSGPVPPIVVPGPGEPPPPGESEEERNERERLAREVERRRLEAEKERLEKEKLEKEKHRPPVTPVPLELQALRRWRATGVLQHETVWSARATKLIGEIPWSAEDEGGWLATTGLGPVKLEGSGQLDSRTVALPHEPWVAEGLEASYRLEKGNVAQAEQEWAIQAVATFMRRARAVVQAWVREKTPRGAGGTAWDYAGTAAQVLLFRAWIRGETRPLAPFEEQWEAVARRLRKSPDEQDAAMERPGARAWNDAVEKLMPVANIVSALSAALKRESALDPADVCAAVLALARDARVPAVPAGPLDTTKATLWMREVAEGAKFVANALSTIPRAEFDRIVDRVGQIAAALGGLPLGTALSRSRNALQKFRESLPTAFHGEVQGALEAMQQRPGFTGDAEGTDGHRVSTFVASRGAFPDGQAGVLRLLDFAITAPARDLEAAVDVLDKVQRAVTTAGTYLKERAGPAGAGVDLAPVHDFAQRITDGTNEALGRLA